MMRNQKVLFNNQGDLLSGRSFINIILLMRAQMKKTMTVFTVLLCFVPALMGSLYLKEDIGISLEEIQVQDLSRSGLKIVFYVNLINSSSEDYYLTKYSYRFITGHKEYLQMQVPIEEGIKVTAMENTMIALPVKVTYDLLFHTAPELAENEMIKCYIKGDFEFFSGRGRRKVLPFDFNGGFPVFNPPEVKIEAIKINDLTIAGSDFDLQVNFTNENGFELLVDRIHYSIRIDGQMINKGTIPGDKSIEKYGEKTFSLNALVNFYDVGRDVYGFFQQDSVECRFSGEMRINTVWGIINLPFDIKEKAPLVKQSA